MWLDFTSTTNSDWLAIGVALLMIPAQFASYILPIYFIGRVFNKARRDGSVVVTAKQIASKTRWGLYLIVCGAALMWVYPNDRFMLYQGAWEVLCGIAIFAFGNSFWASSESYREQPRQRVSR